MTANEPVTSGLYLGAPQNRNDVTTCLKCGRKAMRPHGGGYKCRDCGAEEPPQNRDGHE